MARCRICKLIGTCLESPLETCSEFKESECTFKRGEIVEVSYNGIIWQLAYFAYFRNGAHYAFDKKPEISNPQKAYRWEYCRRYGSLGRENDE